jgi:hypothetical protein
MNLNIQCSSKQYRCWFYRKVNQYLPYILVIGITYLILYWHVQLARLLDSSENKTYACIWKLTGQGLRENVINGQWKKRSICLLNMKHSQYTCTYFLLLISNKAVFLYFIVNALYFLRFRKITDRYMQQSFRIRRAMTCLVLQISPSIYTRGKKLKNQLLFLELRNVFLW